MRKNAILPGAMLLLLLGNAGLQAQTAPYAPPPFVPPMQMALPSVPPTPAEVMGSSGSLPPSPVPNPLSEAGIQPTKADGLHAAHWLGGSGPGCCGPLGNNGSVDDELYVRTGPSIPISGGFLGDRLQVGWMVEAGGRSLFYNVEQDRAWAVELGLGYIGNNGRANQEPAEPRGFPITVRGLDRKYVSLAGGREWYAYRSGDYGSDRGGNLRVGADIGGRLGTSHVDLNLIVPTGEIGYGREHDVYGGYFMAVHSDLDFPVGGWTAFIGVRAEWSVSYLEFVPGDRNDLHDINVLLNMGIRF